jgi:head-tail adaptor
MVIGFLLNTTCTIQTNTPTQDSTYGHQSDSWANSATNVPCRLDGAMGGEQRFSNDIRDKVTHVLFLEYRTDITWDNSRIVIGSDTYNILLVTNAGGESHHLELALEKVE